MTLLDLSLKVQCEGLMTISSCAHFMLYGYLPEDEVNFSGDRWEREVDEKLNRVEQNFNTKTNKRQQNIFSFIFLISSLFLWSSIFCLLEFSKILC